jgi:hypothetical protein
VVRSEDNMKLVAPSRPQGASTSLNVKATQSNHEVTAVPGLQVMPR